MFKGHGEIFSLDYQSKNFSFDLQRFDSTFSGGSGTQADPYKISAIADLQQLATDVNGGTDYSGKYFKLTNDIDLSSVANFTSIGGDYSGDKYFKGTFDGDGHTISNLTINDANGEGRALFGDLGMGGMIKNLNVSGTVTAKSYVGGIVGYNEGTVENCTFSGSVTGSGDYVGGIVGFNYVTVSNCVNNANVSGSKYVGGIVGDNEYYSSSYTAIVQNCVSQNCTISASTQDAGGIVGNNNHTVTNCYATGVNVTGTNSGAVVGSNYYSTYYGTVTSSFYSNCGSLSGVGDNGSGTATTSEKQLYKISNATVSNPNNLTLLSIQGNYYVEAGTYTINGTIQNISGDIYYYVDENGATQAATNPTKITSSTTSLSAGTYVVDGNVTINSQITVSDDVKLILADGAKLTVNGGSNYGIKITSGKSLSIYGQSAGTGTLDAKSNSQYQEAIYPENATLNINSGTVTINGARGIANMGTTINIKGGTVSVTTINSYSIYGTNINISGGQVTVTRQNSSNNVGIYAESTINLGWTNPGDFINVSGYYGTVNIVDGKRGYDTDGVIYNSGTVSNVSALAGKTLRQVGAILTAGNGVTLTDGILKSGSTTEYIVPTGEITATFPAGNENISRSATSTRKSRIQLRLTPSRRKKTVRLQASRQAATGKIMPRLHSTLRATLSQSARRRSLHSSRHLSTAATTSAAKPSNSRRTSTLRQTIGRLSVFILRSSKARSTDKVTQSAAY